MYDPNSVSWSKKHLQPEPPDIHESSKCEDKR